MKVMWITQGLCTMRQFYVECPTTLKSVDISTVIVKACHLHLLKALYSLKFLLFSLGICFIPHAV